MKAVGLQHKVTNTKTCKKLTPDSEKIRIVRRITKAESDSDAVDKALDIVIANSRIEKTLKSVKGKGNIKDIYGRLGSPSQAINRPAISSSPMNRASPISSSPMNRASRLQPASASSPEIYFGV